MIVDRVNSKSVIPKWKQKDERLFSIIIHVTHYCINAILYEFLYFDTEPHLFDNKGLRDYSIEGQNIVSMLEY